MKKVKFSHNEQIVMDAIKEKGEFLWSSIGQPAGIKNALKELMFRELIVRKRQNGSIVSNVFVPTTYGTLAIENNGLAEILNS